jgi:hypothetical protein
MNFGERLLGMQQEDGVCSPLQHTLEAVHGMFGSRSDLAATCKHAEAQKTAPPEHRDHVGVAGNALLQ